VRLFAAVCAGFDSEKLIEGFFAPQVEEKKQQQ